MEFYQALFMLVFMLALFSNPASVEAGYLVAAIQDSIASAATSVPSTVSIGCGSVLAGYLLPPCTSTTDIFSSFLAGVTMITELPIGGAGIGTTPSGLSVFNSPAAPVTATTPTTLNFFTVTATLPAVTLTQTISYATPMTTVTADCFDAAEDVMIPCTTVIPLPSSTTSSSAAIPTAANPFKSLTSSNVFQVLFSQSKHRASPRSIDNRIVRRVMIELCTWDIIAFVLAGINAIAFILFVINAGVKYRNGGVISAWTQVEGFFLLIACCWFLICGLSNTGHC